jgi:hypothetical protein
MLLYTVLTLLPQQPSPTPASMDRASAREEAWFSPEQATTCAAAAERGLRWLTAQQLEAGCWTGIVGHKQEDNYEELAQAMSVHLQRQQNHGHLGVTALCGMAFLAGGHLPDRGPFATVIKRTHDYVISTALENGYLTDAGTRMYSHAFGTLFMAEIYGMAATDAAKTTLERAVNLIVDTQNAYGAWRYNPFDREADLSVTVCQVQALRAARNIGIRVPNETIDRAMKYVLDSRVEGGRYQGLFYYKIYDRRGGKTKPTEYAINAAALTALSSAGVHDDSLTDPVLEFLDQEYGSIADYYSTHFYFWYGNYYAAQAFYQHGGPLCRKFFARLSKDLLESQMTDGRWRNRVGPGDELATAMACILLQMPKQYLPIFQR